MNRSTIGLLVFKWLSICSVVGSVVGSVVALFLWTLDRVTQIHAQHSWLLFLLPIGGLLSGLVYHFWGEKSEAGTAGIVEQIHDPDEGVPMRMAPLVFLGTLITHLFGGSAGREGTAVQMGGSLAGIVGRIFDLNREETRVLLMCGIASGFGAVFGTPVAGTVYALEIVAIGPLRLRALAPCLIASWIGHLVTSAWGIRHGSYQIAFDEMNMLQWLLVGKVVVAAFCFAGISALYATLTNTIRTWYKRAIGVPWLRPFVGGCCVVAFVWLLGERDYCGLGVHSPSMPLDAITIESCFALNGADMLSWLWKLLATSLTIGSGFKGGEVTPLFFMGAASGNSLGVLLGAPVDLLAGLGFVTVFAGVTRSPTASTILAIELFHPFSLGGIVFVIYAAALCGFAAAVCGKPKLRNQIELENSSYQESTR